MKHKELNGAWEEPGVLGTRVEIDGKRITVLWRGGPVLETTFSAEETPEGILLRLKKTGLSYSGDGSPYADVARLLYHDDTLKFVKMFPISGESSETLRRTENSRYGNYDVVDEVLPALAGKWRDESGIWELKIRGNVMEMNGERTHIHVLKSRSSYKSDVYILADQDPSRDGWLGFSRFEYDGQVLRTMLIVCDAPSIDFIFHKV